MRIVLIVFCLVFCYSVFSQENTSYNVHNISIQKKKTVNPSTMPSGYNVELLNLEAPSPDGNSVKAHLLQQKIKSRERFPLRKTSIKKSTSSTPTPIVGKEFGLIRTTGSNEIIIPGGIPNDNTLAISDSGIVLLGVNRFVYAYDLEGDSTIFPFQFIELRDIAEGTVSEFYYDPKVIYDKTNDRFILVFLKDFAPNTSEIVVCFSTTNNPNDEWNVYSLPGNPLSNNRWTDFPAIAITETDLFVTGNLIIPDSTWQAGFDGSVIWQVGKQAGYDGDASLTTILYDDIRFGGNFIRNLHPVQGADGAADELFLLSNRNFDITNDSIFLLQVEGTTASSSTNLSVNVYKSDLNYGVPPNGRQEDTDLQDPTSGLGTNDGRVLGAVKFENEIQFVSNTVNPSTGFAAIYHGTISSLNNSPVITGNIIGDSIRDFGYPNIAWVGNEICDRNMIIGFNYSSPTDFPGITSIYYDNEGNYSDTRTIIEGESYVDRIPGTFERWGDYFGLQRWYNKPERVVSFGYYALENNFNAGWCAELITPDTSKLAITIETDKQTSCSQTITVVPSGGVPPYSYVWINDPTNLTNSFSNICIGDTQEVAVTDSRGCTLTEKVVGDFTQTVPNNVVFPNPFVNQVTIQFDLESDQDIVARIYNTSGHKVVDLIQRSAKKGLNELNFSLSPLGVGEYILRIEAGGKEIISEKIVKYE